MQDKQMKVGTIALVIALLIISQTTAISSLYNYHFFNGTNISIIDDGFGNITISTNASSISDSAKLNNTGDNIYQGTLYINEKPNYAETNLTLGENVGLIMKTLSSEKLICSSYAKSLVSCELSDVNLSDYNNNYGFVNNTTMASDNTKVNKSGDNITGNLIINNTNLSKDPRLQVESGYFSSARSTGSTYYSMGINVYYDNGWKIPNQNERSIMFFFGGAGVGNSNAFVVYQTQTVGGTDFVPLFGSTNQTVGKLGIGTYSPTESLDVKSLIAHGTTTGGNITLDGHIKLKINKGFDTVSPNGNHWCTTTNNLGVNVVAAGVCS